MMLKVCCCISLYVLADAGQMYLIDTEEGETKREGNIKAVSTDELPNKGMKEKTL